MYEVAKLGGYLVSPLALVLGVWLVAILCMALHQRRLALALATIAFAGLWLASTPIVAQALAGKLENSYPALSIEATPTADAIVVLGGSVAGRHPPQRPYIGLNSASTRVWYAAELYRAGKAKWIVVAAGGQPEFASQQVEADAIAEMLVTLGVPARAIQLDAQSRNTLENARYSRAILDRLGANRILLVTSAQHMPRAMKTFAKEWGKSHNLIIPAPTDVELTDRPTSLFSCIPSPSALLAVTKAVKEYAGMAALGIM
jgi:uncharacterized SAM-binding protein YcdF (DUF218 family)